MKKNDTVFFLSFAKEYIFFNRKIPCLTAMHGKFADSDIFLLNFSGKYVFCFLKSNASISYQINSVKESSKYERVTFTYFGKMKFILK